MANTVEEEVAGLTVVIDRESCIGSGACVRVAPEVLELDDEDVVAFTEDLEDQEVERDQIVEACQVCPVDALTVLDESGDQLVP
ncbi:MAG: ferredoxin [Acidobacteriota bacterium]|nr:ferredoxin [Acidobacteriota bacterium]